MSYHFPGTKNMVRQDMTQVSPHWPTLQGLGEAAAFVCMILGAVVVFWVMAL